MTPNEHRGYNALLRAAGYDLEKTAGPLRTLESAPLQTLFALPAVASATMGAYSDGQHFAEGSTPGRYIPAVLAGGTAAAGLGMLAINPAARAALRPLATRATQAMRRPFDEAADVYDTLEGHASQAAAARAMSAEIDELLPGQLTHLGQGTVGLLATPALYAGGSALGRVWAEERDPTLQDRVLSAFGAERGLARFGI